MATAPTTTAKAVKGGSFLLEDRAPEDIFTPEDFTDEQRQIGQMTEEFMTNEVLPQVEKIEHGDKKLLIELTVENDSSREVTLEFSTSGRVCGEFHDPNHKRYYQFPEATAQVMGTESFKAREKRIFKTEIPYEALPKEPRGMNSIAAWLCGYGVQRAWAEFPLHGKPRSER